MSRAVSDLGDLSDLNGLSQLSTAAHTAIGFKLSGGSYQTRTLGHSGRSMISVARVSHILEVAHLVALSATRSLRSRPANAQGTLVTILHSPTVTARTGCAKIAASAHDDFTDLDDRRLVGVLWDVRHNLRSVSPKTGLEFLNRLAENVAHPDVRSGSAGRSARKALVHGVVLARFTQSIFHEGLVPVIVVVEAGARHICIHNTYLNHDLLLIGAAQFSSGTKTNPASDLRALQLGMIASWNPFLAKPAGRSQVCGPIDDASNTSGQAVVLPFGKAGQRDAAVRISPRDIPFLEMKGEYRAVRDVELIAPNKRRENKNSTALWQGSGGRGTRTFAAAIFAPLDLG